MRVPGSTAATKVAVVRQGRSDGGGYRYLYPPKSAQVNFLWGKNDVRTAIQQFYFWLRPCRTFVSWLFFFLLRKLFALYCVMRSSIFSALKEKRMRVSQTARLRFRRFNSKCETVRVLLLVVPISPFISPI